MKSVFVKIGLPCLALPCLALPMLCVQALDQAEGEYFAGTSVGFSLLYSDLDLKSYPCRFLFHNYYEQGDIETDQSTRKIGQRPFTVDLMGIVHFCKGGGIYFKYSPMSVLKKDKGPEFKSFAVGLYF